MTHAIETVTCKYCGQPVIWVALTWEKAMPFDAVPTERGRWKLEHDATGILRAEKANNGTRYVAHELTCADVKAWKR